jgi:hypothetical protein
MKKKVVSLLSVLLAIMLLVTPVAAGGAIKLSGAFGIGSLTFDGTMTGVGGYREGVNVILEGSGIPVVTCTNQGSNPAPGQNPSQITASGFQFIGPVNIDEKGKATVGVETLDPVISGTEGGCSNDNWTATVDFVYWTNATIYVYDNVSGALAAKQNYTCVTTRNPDSVNCTLVK